jgi:hypothetical protein
MRTSIKVSVMLLLMLSGYTLTSCNDTDDGSYVAPITQYEKVGGKWVLNSITQVDETSSKTMALTSLLDFGSFVINLNTDEQGSPTSFTIDGSAPALLPASGTWKLENPFVNSDGSSAKILLNDKIALTVTAVPGAQKVLEFKLTRKSGGKAYVSYIYNLIPVSE